MNDKGVTETPSPVCTQVCTSNTENSNGNPLDALAAALLGLSPADRAKLSVLLTATGNQP